VSDPTQEASAAKAARTTRSKALPANVTAARRKDAMMNPKENNPKSGTKPDESRDRHEDLPGLDPDKPQRSEQGTDHIEDPEQVAEHVSEIDRKDPGEEE
jgi:hypothetical protein